MNNKKPFLGFNICTISPQKIVDEITESIEVFDKNSVTKFFACLNPHAYFIAKKDKLFERSLKEANWLVADGIGIIVGYFLLESSRILRCPGPDIFNTINKEANKKSLSIFLLGSDLENLIGIAQKLSNEFSSINIKGIYSPPYKGSFSKEDNEKMISIINSLSPDILWVGMSAPKQEKWTFEHIKSLDVKFIGAVGAAFDFYSGRIKRSNTVFRKYGLEWLPRLIQEPKRLWRRVFISAPIFFIDIAKALLLKK